MRWSFGPQSIGIPPAIVTAYHPGLPRAVQTWRWWGDAGSSGRAFLSFRLIETGIAGGQLGFCAGPISAT